MTVTLIFCLTAVGLVLVIMAIVWAMLPSKKYDNHEGGSSLTSTRYVPEKQSIYKHDIDEAPRRSTQSDDDSSAIE